MKIIEKYNIFLHDGIFIIQAIAYTMSFIVISFSILKSIFIYISEYNEKLESFNKIRLILGKSTALSLSFILGVEILKLFYINHYKQLVIVITLVVIKLLVTYFLLNEINEITTKKGA